MVGKYFSGYSYKHQKLQIYICTAIDPDNVYVENIYDSEEKKALGPRAIGRTFHEVEQDQNGTWR